MSEKNVGCLAVYEVDSSGKKNYIGLFDVSLKIPPLPDMLC